MGLMANEGIELEILSYDDVLGDPKWILPGRKDPQFLEELGSTGGGSFFLPRQDPKLIADPDILDSRNVCRFKVNGNRVGAFLLGGRETAISRAGERAELGYTPAGEGLKAWFNDATVKPYGGLKQGSGANRYFNFSTVQRGDWYVDSQWVDPFWFGTRANGPYPPEWAAKFPANASHAQWFWGSPFESFMPSQPVYIRWEFGVTDAANYALYLGVDDEFTVFIDGEQIAKSNEKSSSVYEVARLEFSLTAGLHVMGIIGRNWDTPPGNPWNPAAAIFALERLEEDGSETLIGASTPGYGYIHIMPYPVAAPGWSVGEVLLDLLDEAEARGVLFPTYLTPTFTSTHDSYGVPWPEKLEWTFKVGESYSSVLDKIEEFYDVWIDADFRLHMAPERGDVHDAGSDLPIKFFIGKHLQEASSTVDGNIKNSIDMETTEGWVNAIDTTSVSKYGRLESAMSTDTDVAFSNKLADLVFARKAQEEIGASYKLTPTTHIPWVHFGVGDWVLAPNERGETVLRRVMSISVAEGPGGRPDYTIEFDTIFRAAEDRLNRIVSKMSGGGVGGGLSNAGGITPGGGGGIVLPPTTNPIRTRPNAPSAVSADSEGYWTANGVTPMSKVTVSWTPVTTNEDGTAIVPERYEVFAKSSSTPEAGLQMVGSTSALTLELANYIPGTEWEFQVQTVTVDGDRSVLSAPAIETMLGPTEPMLPPSTPTLQSELGLLILNWDGLLNNSTTPPPHFRYAYIEVKPQNSGSWTKVAIVLQRDSRQIVIPNLPIGTSYVARLTAVDGVGIESPKSAISAPITITGVDLGNLDQVVRDAIEAAQDAADDAYELADMAATIADGAKALSDQAATDAQAALDQVLESIVSSLDEYVVTDSSTVVPGPGAAWSSDTPDWGPGQYVWRRSKNTHVNGSVTYSNPAVLTGAEGEDAVLLRVDSTRGNAFKNNAISTVLRVTVFKGSQQIVDITTLHEVFGSASYLEWWWRRMDDTDFGVISSADPRLSQGGFALTISPADVDEKTDFQCILNTP